MSSFVQSVIQRFVTREVALALMVIGAAVLFIAVSLFVRLVAICFSSADFKNKPSGGTLR